jgi:hypothetical protein
MTLANIRSFCHPSWKSNKYYIFLVCAWGQVPSTQCACAMLSSVAHPTLIYFSTLFHKAARFPKKKLLNIKFILFSQIWNIFQSKKNWTRYDQKFISVYMQSIRNSWATLMRLEFSPQIFKKYFNIQFNENSSSGRHANRRTDGQKDNMTTLIVGF